MSRLLSLLSDIRPVFGISRLLLSNPKKLYSFMPVTGGYTDPLIFVGVMSVLGTVFVVAIQFFGLTSLGLGGFRLGLSPFWHTLFYPLLGVGGSFVLAGFMYGVWRVLGADKKFEVAYRCVAYTCVILPILAIGIFIPYVGLAICVVWWIWLIAHATEIVYGQSKTRIVLLLGCLGVFLLYYSIQGEEIQRKTTDRTMEFNNQMRKLEEMSVDLK